MRINCFINILVATVFLSLLPFGSNSAWADTCWNLDGSYSECWEYTPPVRRSGPRKPTPKQTRQQKVRNLTVLGDKAMEDGNWGKAIKYFNQALNLIPGDESVKARIERAEKAIRRENAVEIHNRGIERLKNQDYEGAIKLLEQALQKFPLPETKRELKNARQRQRNAQIKALTHQTEIKKEKFQGGMKKSIDRISAKLKRSGVGATSNSALNQLRQMSQDGITAKKAGLDLKILELNAGKKKSGCTVDGSCPDSIGDNLSATSIKDTKPALPAVQGAAVSNDRVIRALDQEISSLDRQIKKIRDPRKKQELLKSQIFHLNEQSRLLEGEISREKDPVKRAHMINKQSAVNSKKATQEIQRLDLSIKGPGI